MTMLSLKKRNPTAFAYMVKLESMSPVRLGSLRQKGEPLQVRCIKCHRSTEFDCRALPQSDEFPYPLLQFIFRCTGCGNLNGEKPGWHFINITAGSAVHPHEIEAAHGL